MKRVDEASTFGFALQRLHDRPKANQNLHSNSLLQSIAYETFACTLSSQSGTEYMLQVLRFWVLRLESFSVSPALSLDRSFELKLLVV
jgi:hypothetical protein